MVKFSSLIQFREYIENLPLEFIVTELFRVKGRRGPQRFGEDISSLLFGGTAWVDNCEDVEPASLVGKISFRLIAETYSSGTPSFSNAGNERLNRDVYEGLLLYCTYYHDTHDVWVIPFEISQIYFRLQINDESALKPLYYTPERPIVNISEPKRFWKAMQDGRSGGGNKLTNRLISRGEPYPLAIRFYLRKRVGKPAPYRWRWEDIEVLYRGESEWYKNPITKDIAEPEEYVLYNTKLERWVPSVNYWRNAEGERRKYGDGRKPPIEFAEKGVYYKDIDDGIYVVQDGKYVLLENHHYLGLNKNFDVARWLDEGNHGDRDYLAKSFLLFGEGFPNSDFHNICKLVNPSSFGLLLDFDLVELHTSADYTEFFLLFDPYQTAALNYPQGDFVVI